MARTVSVGGQTTGIPGVRQNSVTPEGGGVPGSLPSGVVALIGECEGTIQPGVVTEYYSPQKLKRELKSGVLYDASRFAFDPSRDDKLKTSGAQKLLNIRVNPATQSSTTFVNGSAAALMVLTSRAYGIVANSISAALAVATDGPGIKLTVSQLGETDEVGDNLGFNPIFVIRYTGNGTTAVMTISSTALTTTLAGDESDGSANLSVSFSTYDTIEKLSAYVNAQTGYEMVVWTPKPASYLCANLDYVTGADIKLVDSGSVSLAATTTTSMTLSSVTAGNVVRLDNSEFVYITTAGAPNTVIRGYMDTAAAIHSSVDADEFYTAKGINQAVIDWCNNKSARVTAARTTTNVSSVAVQTRTFFSGGSEGTTTSAEWQAALDALRAHRVNFIVVLSDNAAYHALLKTHLDWRWGAGNSEALGHVGAAQGETLAQLKVRAKALNSKRIALHFIDVNRDNDQGVDTNYAPWAKAVMAAASQAGSKFGVPLTYTSLNVSAIGHNSAIDLIDDAEAMVEYGICHARFWDNEFRFVRCLTTWTNDDTPMFIELNVAHAVAWTLYKVRDRIRFFHLGNEAKSGNANAIKGTVQVTLEQIRDVDEAIVKGSRLVNGRREAIPAFDSIVVTQTGNVADASYRFVPIGGTDFVNVDSAVGVFQDAA